MDVWLNRDCFLGSFKTMESVQENLSSWQNETPDMIIYMIEWQGRQMSFVDHWQKFLEENIHTKEPVYLLTSSRQDLATDLKGSSQEYIDRMIDLLPNLVDKFYAGPSQVDWQTLADLIEGLMFMQEAFLILWMNGGDQEKFFAIMQDLLAAVEGQDTLAIADIIRFELEPWICSVAKEFIKH